MCDQAQWCASCYRDKERFLIYLNVKTREECHVAEEDIELWHRRLGHASYGVVNEMVKDGRLSSVKMKSDAECDVCATAKQARKTFKASNEDYEGKESARSDEVVCLDVLGLITCRK